MRARRALLYMPANELRKIEKASSLDVDSVCMDLEDGVALNRKNEARQTAAQALRTLEFGRSERLVRINGPGSGLEADDLAVILHCRPDGIVIPKVKDGDQIRWASERISAVERDHGWEAGAIGLLAIVESARGIVNLPRIACADNRLRALIFGAEDLAGDIGATRTRDGWEVFYARSALVTYAAAFGLQAVDMVYVEYHDVEGLRREALQGASMGFMGKQIIHPDQVAPVQEAFTPGDEEIARARRIVDAHDAYQAAGAGAFTLDGMMVDMPVVKTAERLLARARAAGKL